MDELTKKIYAFVLVMLAMIIYFMSLIFLRLTDLYATLIEVSIR